MKVSQKPSDVQVVPLSSPHTNNMPLLSPPRQPPAIEFSIVELILQCAKLQSKDLAKFLKRLLEPNNSSKNSKEYREQAQTLVENIMSLLLVTFQNKDIARLKQISHKTLVRQQVKSLTHGVHQQVSVDVTTAVLEDHALSRNITPMLPLADKLLNCTYVTYQINRHTFVLK
jgi:lysyl-tRNA synthetase class I